MKEQLINFETAKLAKEKGVKLDINGLYWEDGSYDSGENALVYEEFQDVMSAPTQSLLQKWLREVHDIFISINTTSDFRWNSDDEGDQEYLPVHQFRIVKNKDNYKYDVTDWSSVYDIYEEALEIGLYQALKLIK